MRKLLASAALICLLGAYYFEDCWLDHGNDILLLIFLILATAFVLSKTKVNIALKNISLLLLIGSPIFLLLNSVHCDVEEFLLVIMIVFLIGNAFDLNREFILKTKAGASKLKDEYIKESKLNREIRVKKKKLELDELNKKIKNTKDPRL